MLKPTNVAKCILNKYYICLFGVNVNFVCINHSTLYVIVIIECSARSLIDDMLNMLHFINT